MKNLKIALFAFLATTTLAKAHCPASEPSEKVCFMLEKNLLYIYDHKFEHNGPYKDFEHTEVLGLKSPKGETLVYKKIARGIYKIESPEIFKQVTLEVSLKDKKKKEIKISHE